jgi:enoyl-CoA hydratase/carnithine racemase
MVVTLAFPERRNALRPDDIDLLREAVLDATRDRGCHGVVITGQGAFCAGADLHAILALVQSGAQAVRQAVKGSYQRLVLDMAQSEVPLIAAVDGPAIGLGFDIALACDMRLMSEQGSLILGWPTLGLIPGAGGLLLLERRATPGVIWHLAGRREPVRMEEAARLGLCEPTAAGTALVAAVAKVNNWGSIPRDVLSEYARMQRGDLHEALETHLKECLDIQTRLLTQGEFSARAQHLMAGSGLHKEAPGDGRCELDEGNRA